MKNSSKVLLIIIGISTIIGYLTYLSSTLANGESGLNAEKESALPIEVDWTTAVEILNSGKVAEVLQYHNLEVTLTLKDGSQIKTVEPSIDEIFREIELCGNVCSDMLLITE